MRLRGCAVKVGKDVDKAVKARFQDLAITLHSTSLGQKLNVVCKDRKEFQTWSTALLYLAEHGPPPESSRRDRTASGGLRLQRRGTATLEGVGDLDKRRKGGAAADKKRKGVTSKQLRGNISGALPACSCPTRAPPRSPVRRDE